MVRKVLSRYNHSPPDDETANRKIQTPSALYPVDEVRSILKPDSIDYATNKASFQAQQLSFSFDDICELINDAFDTGRYIDSEWCIGKRGHWLACDSYCIRRHEFIEAAHKVMQIEYFIKFCIGKMGTIVLIVSCHLSS